MITAWRLVKRIHAETAFDGEGAKRFGGRWSRSGVTVVYLSESLALAALEAFVHFRRAASRIEHVSFRIEIPQEVVIEEIDRNELRHDWREEPAPESTKVLGTQWVASGGSAVLRVPSVLVPYEFNFMINLSHPDFKSIRIGEPEPFSFDRKMWKS